MGVISDAVAQDDDEELPTVLRVGFMQKVDSLNPYVGLVDAAYVYYGMVYDALGVIDEDMKPIPDLLRGDTLSEGAWAVPLSDPEMQASGMPYGSVWQYNISDQVKFHDGQPLTADDVVWNVNLNAQNFDEMWAYQPYSFFMKEAVKIDQYTVRVYFWDKATGDPAPASFAYLVSIPMLPRHLLKDLTPSYIGFHWNGLFDEPGVPTIVGTGPFMGNPDIADEYAGGDHITLITNPDFHWQRTKVDANGDPVDVDFDQLYMRFFDDSTGMVLALKNNEIDIAQFPPQAYKSIKADVEAGRLSNVTTFDGPKCTQYWTEVGCCMNSGGGSNPSRVDQTIRQALAHATDKEYIVDTYYGGLAEPGTTLIPPVNTEWHYEPTAEEFFEFDVALANQMLEDGGYVDTDDDGIREATVDSWAVQEQIVSEGTPLQYEMLVRREYPEERDIAMYLESQWSQIGIDINYIVVDEVLLGTLVYSYDVDFYIWYWSADIDPNYQLFCLSEKSWYGWNDGMYSTPEYEDNYSMSVWTVDAAERKQYTDNCQKVFYEDCSYLILAYVNQTYAWRTDQFVGWGDWLAHPGRSMDNFWMGNPLFFDLEVPVPAPPPEVPWLAIAATIAVIAGIVVAAIYLKTRGKKKEGSIKGDSPLGD